MQRLTQRSRRSTVALIFKKMKDKLFGNRLKTLRINKGYTQLELGEKLGLKESAIQSHEYGQWPNRNNLQKYLDFYKCDEAWFMTGQGEPYPGRPGAPLYKVAAAPAPEHVSDKDSGYDPHGGWQPKLQGEDYNLIGKTFEILQSDGIYRQALASNIKAFHAALNSEKTVLDQGKKLADLENKCNEALKRIEALEKPPDKIDDEPEAAAQGG